MRPISTILRRLLIFALMATLPLTGVIGFALYRQFQSDQRRVLDQLQILAETNTQQLAAYVSNTRHKLKTLAAEDAVVDVQPAEAEAMFQSFISFNPRFANIGLLNTDGRVLVAANQKPLNPKTSLLFLDRYRDALASKDLHISAPYVRALSG